MTTRGGSGKPTAAPVPDDAIDLFREAVRDARPLPDPGKVVPAQDRPKPIPYQSLKDETEALADSLSDTIPWENDLEDSEDQWHVRNGISRQVIRKLRRGHWVIQAQLDLHGMVSDEARMQLIEFLAGCLRRDVRCVRIIHGKGLGSPNREPVLKRKVRNWLRQKEEVLAFCEARTVDGGSGAVIVLLRSK